MAAKPSVPKGTRDFGPLESARRNYIFETIGSVFRTFGYSRIETPAMESLQTLLGKYGDEGDKLLFRILDSGDPFTEVDFESFRGEDGTVNAPALSSKLCGKGLRYDLTVPFARFVVQHREELPFPFKRYQMQPVWRADRPQKGRYREFWQCDADVIGTKSLLCETELVQIVEKVFSMLGIRVLIKVNNRKVLTGLAEVCGFPEKVVDITVAIDKLEKIGLDAVREELLSKGLTPEAVALLEPVLLLQGDTPSKIARMRTVLAGSETGLRGLDELEELFGLVAAAGVEVPVEMDLSLARGLNYYTGAIFEVKALDYQIGSICGGGRYDDLTGIFGLPGMSGVGISFGADRIYDVLLALEKFPSSDASAPRLLFANMGPSEAAWVLPVAAALREKGVSVEVYPDAAKLRKQFEYADRRGIPFLGLCGESEVAGGQVRIKDLASGQESLFGRDEIDPISALVG